MESDFQKVFESFVSTKQQIVKNDLKLDINQIDVQVRDALCLSLDSDVIEPSNLFWSDFYIASNQDLQRKEINPWQHFMANGLAENRSPHPLLDAKVIESQVPTFRGLSPVERYLLDPMFWLATPNRWTNISSYVSSGRWDGKRHPLISLLNDPLINHFVSNPLLLIDSGSPQEGFGIAYAYFSTRPSQQQDRNEVKFTQLISKTDFINAGPRKICVDPGFGIDFGDGYFAFTNKATDDHYQVLRLDSSVAMSRHFLASLDCENIVIFERNYYGDELKSLVSQFSSKESIFVAFSELQLVALKSLTKGEKIRVINKPAEVSYKEMHLAEDLVKYKTSLPLSSLWNSKRETFILTTSDAELAMSDSKSKRKLMDGHLMVIDSPSFRQDLFQSLGNRPIVVSETYLEPLKSFVSVRKVRSFSTWKENL